MTDDDVMDKAVAIARATTERALAAAPMAWLPAGHLRSFGIDIPAHVQDDYVLLCKYDTDTTISVVVPGRIDGIDVKVKVGM